MILLGSIVTGSLTMATPLLLASIGETVVERSGVVNVGLEGMILSGALAAVLGTAYLHNPLIGVMCALLGGVLVATLFAQFAVRLCANQVVVGVVVNLMALGLTGTISRACFSNQHTFITVAALPHLIGDQTFLMPLALVLVPATWWWLYRTPAGLKLRACGEHPVAADAAGVNVLHVRNIAVAFGGALAGIAGACLTIGDVPTFQENMSAGRGFIALAIVTSGRWNPIGCLIAALIFGVSEEIEIQAQAMHLPVPHSLLLALPYLVTLLILASGSKSSQAPAALGIPYRRA